MKRHLPDGGLLGDIQKIPEWAGTLPKNGLIHLRNSKQFRCPGNRVHGYMAQDLERIREELKMKFPMC